MVSYEIVYPEEFIKNHIDRLLAIFKRKIKNKRSWGFPERRQSGILDRRQKCRRRGATDRRKKPPAGA